MKKMIFAVLSLVPGVVLAEGPSAVSKVRVTVKSSDNILNAVSAVQRTSLGMGASQVNLTLDSNKNTVEVLVGRNDTADVLVANLKSLLGTDAFVEKVKIETMKYGTQDDIMKP